MNAKIFSEDDFTIIQFSGRMDATNATILEETLEQCFSKEQRKIIIDFSMLEYISSAGLRSILIVEKKRTSQNVDIVFCSLQDMVKEIRVADNMEEAKKSLS